MENRVLEAVKDIKRKDGVTGFVCTDENGFPYAVTGEAPKDAAGYISSLASTAEKLSVEKPSIVIETTKRKILIGRDENMTVGIYIEKKK